MAATHVMRVRLPPPTPTSTIYVTVCKNTVLSNLKRGENKPPLRISIGKHGKPHYAHTFDFHGQARIVYDPKHPMPWGARAWVEIATGGPIYEEE